MTTEDPKVFHGQQAEVIVADVIEDVDDTENLYDQVTESNGTEFTGVAMDIDINDPEADVDVENTFGGQIKVEMPADGVEIDATLRFRDIEWFEQMHGEGEDVGDGEYYRVSGSKTPGDRPRKAFLFHVEAEIGGETYVINYLINDAIFTHAGEVSLDAEGFAEVTGTVTGLVEDRYIERNF